MIPLHDISSKYGNEIALAVLCCRIHFKTEPGISLQPFIDSHTIDWHHVLYLCDYHRIEPVVYKVLGNAKIPANIAAEMKQRRMFLIQQSFKQAVETERIITFLSTNGISCVPYKGVAFSLQFYGDLVSRESSDIDLVIYNQDFDTLIRLMENSGYAIENRLEYNYFRNDIVKRAKELNFNRYKGGSREFHVEFHWQISDHINRVAKKANTFFINAPEKEILVKNNIEMLDVNAHYLAVFIHHSNNDAFSVLRNIVDLAQIACSTHSSVDISYIRQQMKDFHLTKAANICGYLTGSILGVDYPLCKETRRKPEPDKVKDFFLAQLLDRQKLGEHFKIKPVKRSILYLKDRPMDKFNYLVACACMRFTPSRKDIRVFNLPKRFYFLYFILKPFRSLLSPVSNQEEKDAAQKQTAEKPGAANQ